MVQEVLVYFWKFVNATSRVHALNDGDWYNKVYEKEFFVTVYDGLWQKTCYQFYDCYVVSFTQTFDQYDMVHCD